MIANVIPTNLGIGSCVCHPESLFTLGVITGVTEDGQKMCTVKYKRDDGCSTEELPMDKLRLYDGPLTFDVLRLNVQGGGILKSKELDGIIDNTSSSGLSMKWLTCVSENIQDYNDRRSEEEKVDEEEKVRFKVPNIPGSLRGLNPGERLEDRVFGGCWYFDPRQQKINPSGAGKAEETLKYRTQNLDMIEEDDGLEVLKYEQQKLLVNYTGMPEDFCQALLSTPFLLYEDMVDYILLLFQGNVNLEEEDKENLEDWDLQHDDWCEMFHTIVVTGILLRKDKEWHEANAKLDALNDEDLNQRFDASLYRIINKVGEWYEEQKEFRAAIWCYNLNLESAKDTNVWFPPRSRKECLISQLNYIGLANKQMDNFVEATRIYEEAIIECSSAHSSSFSTSDAKNNLLKNVTGNSKKLQQEAKYWFGTSGRITSWAAAEADGNTVIATRNCKSCGSEGAAKKCSGCSQVSYCNANCQSDSWKLVHKHTCLGKLRGK